MEAGGHSPREKAELCRDQQAGRGGKTGRGRALCSVVPRAACGSPQDSLGPGRLLL